MNYVFLIDDWGTLQTQGAELAESVDRFCWILAAVFGLVGGLKIYNKWQLHSHHHIQIDAEIAMWLAGCIFFIVAHFFIWVIF